jgi:hypothetical protein
MGAYPSHDGEAVVNVVMAGRICTWRPGLVAWWLVDRRPVVLWCGGAVVEGGRGGVVGGGEGADADVAF